MAYNGSGVFSRVRNWVTDKGNAVPVTASLMDSEMDGIATGLSAAICKDGQQVTTARIPFVLGTSAFQGALAGVSYSFTNDVDTGFYSPTTDQVAFAAGGVQVLASTATTLTVPIALAVTGNISAAGTFTASATASAGFFSGFGAVPVGAVMDYAGTLAPAGWLFCFGQSLSRVTNAALFNQIGTAYGAVDGTHFNVPDLRGRKTAGRDDMGGSAASRITSAGSSIDGVTIGAAGGAQNKVIVQANFPSGSLTMSAGTLSPNNLYQRRGGGASAVAAGADISVYPTSSFSDVTPAIATLDLGGSGTALVTISPTFILNKIIFAGV